MHSKIYWKIQEYIIKYGHEPDLLLLPAYIYEQLITEENLNFLRTIEKTKDEGYDKESTSPKPNKAFGLEFIPHMGDEIIALKKYDRNGGF